MATETLTPIERLRRLINLAELVHHPDSDTELTADARAALENVEALVKELGEMPCWSPYEGAYFTGCDHRVPPRMDRHSFDTDDERCRRCTALAKFQEAQQ